MINNAASARLSAAVAPAAAEQLTLLPSARVTPRFRLSKDTRERGLRHVAEIRQMLAERADAAPRTNHIDHTLDRRHDRAA